MPLLCISLCALLLLPLTLSCNSRNPPEQIARGYRQVVQTELNRTKTHIAELLQNSPCRRHKRLNCTSNSTDFVTTLFTLACKMKKLGTDTIYLAQSVEASINCFCVQNVQKMGKRENKKLCKAMAFLSNMDECYQLLNINYGHLRPASSIS